MDTEKQKSRYSLPIGLAAVATMQTAFMTIMLSASKRRADLGTVEYCQESESLLNGLFYGVTLPALTFYALALVSAVYISKTKPKE